MKKITRSIITATSILSAFAFTDVCDTMLIFKEGASITMTSYNDDGKLTGTSTTVYSKSGKTNLGTFVTATQEHFDKKGKPSMKNEFLIKCEKGKLLFDMKMMVPQQESEAYKDMEMTIEGSDLEMPGNLAVGAILKDASIKMSFKPKGANTDINLPGMTFQMAVTNRKVEAKESITVAAGTFECYKISESIEMKTMFSIKAKSINWFSPEVGNVRTESYKENGKYTGKTELTEIKK